ncbi:MAG: DUF4136 domain-containing protein [Gammaproteobacteria bacterium]|nr:DUF4136 domain-containing protein [Gammaproteobacteria bacterium]
MIATRRTAAWIIAACAALLLAGCATSPRISFEADPRADFSAFRTWAFYDPLAVESYGYETATSEIVKRAVRREMDARGYAYDAENPDLWVNVNAYMQRRTDVSSIPTVDHAYYYSYRHRAYFAVPFWHDRTHVRRYTEGTMNVDLVDARQNRLVWEGIAVGRVTNMTVENREQRIRQAIGEIFARYPHRAGAAAPPM